MIVVGELFYVTLSFDAITEEEAKKIWDFAVQMRGTRSGMSISYSEPIV